MKATVSEPESWKRVLEIEIPAQEVENAYEEKLTKYRKDLKIPGFRPGHVPATIVKQRFGSAIKGEVIDDLVQKSYQTACEENKITPVSQAKVKDIKADEGQPVRFTVETEVDPPIEIKGYNKLKIKPNPKKIKDSDVDEAVKNLQDRLAEFKDVDRPSKKGDFVRLEYLKVIVDGEEKKEVQSPNYPVELGAESRIKDFDKGLIGHAANEVVDISVKFPKDYADSSVAGQSGDFQIKITAVQEKVLPEINEEFLKKVGDYKDEAALREGIRAQIEKEEIDKSKNEAYNRAIDQLIKDNHFEVPPARVEAFINYMHEESMKYRRDNNPVPSLDEIKQRYEEIAVRSIKRQRIIDYIAEKENIKATQEDVDREIDRIAKMYNQPFDTVKQAFRKNGTTNRIRVDVREQKTLDFLINEYTPAQESAENKE